MATLLNVFSRLKVSHSDGFNTNLAKKTTYALLMLKVAFILVTIGSPSDFDNGNYCPNLD